FNKRSQLFIGTHNEALSVVTRVNNPDRSGRENRRLTRSPKSIRLAEIVGDDLLVVHAAPQHGNEVPEATGGLTTSPTAEIRDGASLTRINRYCSVITHEFLDASRSQSSCLWASLNGRCEIGNSQTISLLPAKSKAL